MMWNPNLTADECRETMRGLVELELWYAYSKKGEKGFDFRTAVSSLTEVYRFSSFYDRGIPAEDNSRWNEFLLSFSGEDAGRDADAAMRDLGPGVRLKMEKAEAELSSSFKGFLYEFRPAYFKPAGSPDCLTLHFRNYFAPESPAGRAGELARGLMGLVRRASAERPDVKTVQCATWLNRIPFFAGLFPPEWAGRGEECPYEPSTGWWGQFINREGRIHGANARYLKTRGDFKYKNVNCLCGTDSLCRNLEEIQGKRHGRRGG